MASSPHKFWPLFMLYSMYYSAWRETGLLFANSLQHPDHCLPECLNTPASLKPVSSVHNPLPSLAATMSCLSPLFSSTSISVIL